MSRTSSQSLTAALGALREGRFTAAEEEARRVLASTPDHPRALHVLGMALAGGGRADDALSPLRRATELAPKVFEFQVNAGAVFARKGLLDEAAAAFRRACSIQPTNPVPFANLARALLDARQIREAEAAARQAVALGCPRAGTRATLATALRESGRLTESLTCARDALSREPQNLRSLIAEAFTLGALGDADGAIASYRRLLAVQPGDAVQHSNLLFTMHYSPAVSRQELFDEHRAWAARHAAHLYPPSPSYGNDRDSRRRLRVGYVSPDFRFHIVGRLLMPLFRHHDKAAVEVFCYSDVRHGDEYTGRLKGFTDCWRDTQGMRDQAVAELIREDKIDVLFDPSGHIGGHRLKLFARKPAPVQCTHMGYPNTTGLETMDYRFSDVASEPFGEGEPYNSEVLVRLKDCWYCYLPDDPVSPPAPPPSTSAGHVTFGCFNKLIKVSPPCVETWAALLRRVSHSRLLLLVDGSREDMSGLLAQFARHGVNESRIEFAGKRPHNAYMALHDKIDIQLDPFPFNGDNTLCDGMWCGVPPVALEGDRFVSRRGVSHLRAVGLPELIGRTPDEYVERAAGLAESPARLAEIRASLRDRMTASPLSNAAAFARKIEGAYREMWGRWLEGRARDPWPGEVSG